VLAPDVDGQGAIRLPLTAIVDDGGTRRGWVVDKQTQRVAPREVTISSAQNDNVLVTGGLTGGETVVTAGVHMLQPNQHVLLAGGGK
jgi:multidrug efflux pump subunit AcrA (membrane-fusion protein)